jgi:hypothetical protein
LDPSITGIPAKDGGGVITLTKIAITTFVTDNFSVFNAFSFNNQMLRKVC